MENRIQKIITEFGPYLEDLRKRIYRIAVFFIFFFVVGFLLSGQIIKIIVSVVNLDNVAIVVTSPFQILGLGVDIGMFLAIIITLPFVIWNLYFFIKPALSGPEINSMFLIFPISFILFVAGFAYGFFALYWGLKTIAMLNVSFGLQNIWDIGLFLSQMAVTAALLGALFQFPIIMTFLIRLGIISRQLLVKQRRLAHLIIFIVVALLPPTDGLSLVIMSVPLILLYEITVWLNRFSKNEVLTS